MVPGQPLGKPKAVNTLPEADAELFEIGHKHGSRVQVAIQRKLEAARNGFVAPNDLQKVKGSRVGLWEVRANRGIQIRAVLAVLGDEWLVLTYFVKSKPSHKEQDAHFERAERRLADHEATG